MTSNYSPSSKHYVTGDPSWPAPPTSSQYIQTMPISSTGDNRIRSAVTLQERWQNWQNTTWSYDTFQERRMEEQTPYRNDQTTTREHETTRTSQSSLTQCSSAADHRRTTTRTENVD